MPRGDVSSFFFDDVVREDFFLECVNSYFIRFLYLHHTPQYTIIVDKTIVSPPSVEYVNDFLVFLFFHFPTIPVFNVFSSLDLTDRMLFGSCVSKIYMR